MTPELQNSRSSCATAASPENSAAPDEAFLLADDPVYRETAARVFRQAPTVPAADAGRFAAGVRDALGPYLRGGLLDPQWLNMYPFIGTA